MRGCTNTHVRFAKESSLTGREVIESRSIVQRAVMEIPKKENPHGIKTKSLHGQLQTDSRKGTSLQLNLRKGTHSVKKTTGGKGVVT